MSNREQMGESVPTGLVARVVQGVKYVVTGRGPDAWFGPLKPLEPVAPPNTAGRQFDYPVGFNATIQPRQGEPISFPMLRNLADNYDLMRLVIETRKDQLAKESWAIQPKDPKKKKIDDPRIAEVSDFLAMPDKENDWDAWLRMLVEDNLVIDAATLYPRLDRGNRLYALEPVDGATIKRVLDGGGRTPIPPDPAYQQVLKGLPASDYTRGQLLYLPRNLRTNRVYGMSPVEQVVMTVNIALRRQMHQLDYYTEGTVPDALAGVPDSWTPEQIAQYQAYWDALLTDNLAQRRKVRWVPGSIAKSFVQIKDAALKDEYDEWLARIMCYAFNVSNQAFIKQMSRAESETSAVQAMKEGLAPLKKWVKAVIDRVLRQCFGYADLEFVWQETKDTDPLVDAQVNDIKVRAGAKTLNEWRAEDGEEAIAGGDVALIYTAAGAVRLEDVVKPPEPPPAMLGHNGISDIGTEDDSGDGTEGEDDGTAQLGKADAAREVDHTRPFVGKRLKKVRRQWTRFLAAEAKRVADQVAAARSKMVKAAGDDLENAGAAAAAKDAVTADSEAASPSAETTVAAQIAGDAVDEAVWAQEVAKTAQVLGEVAVDGVGQGLKVAGITSADATALANPRAIGWAQSHAADLVSGLTNTTRKALRDIIAEAEANGWSVQRLRDAIMESHAFSADRATLIATHELASADIMGNLIGWRTAVESFGVKLKKRWIEAPEENHCPACNENARAGAIGLDEDFPSGHQAAPAHPRCGCDLVAEVDDDADKVEGPRASRPFDLAKGWSEGDHPRGARGRFVLKPGKRAKGERRQARGEGGGRRPPKIAHLGAMPHDVVGRTLGRKLQAGAITMKLPATAHADDRHRDELALVARTLAKGIDKPVYVGLLTRSEMGDGLNTALYYPVGDGTGRMAVLPVSIDRDGEGVYRGRTGFIATREAVAHRLTAGKIQKAK